MCPKERSESSCLCTSPKQVWRVGKCRCLQARAGPPGEPGKAMPCDSPWTRRSPFLSLQRGPRTPVPGHPYLLAAGSGCGGRVGWHAVSPRPAEHPGRAVGSGRGVRAAPQQVWVSKGQRPEQEMCSANPAEAAAATAPALSRVCSGE